MLTNCSNLNYLVTHMHTHTHTRTQDFHRKLEVEKSDRRVSDSRALQLLQEVKEKGLLAQKLREKQAR